jgi:drug/metabolite transporter (DMT)-like permease
MIFSIGLVFLAVLLTGISQVLLKIGSQKGGGDTRFFMAYLNIPTMTGYGILLVVTVISVIALVEVPLKMFYAIASLNFFVVAVLSWGILKEEVSKKMVLGILLIVMGVLVFNV